MLELGTERRRIATPRPAAWRIVVGVDLEPGAHLIFGGHPFWRSILGFYAKGLVIVTVAGALAASVTRIADAKVNVVAPAARQGAW